MLTDTRARSPDAETASPVDRGESTPLWFDLAHAMAQTGCYRNVAEVEAALRDREASIPPSRNAIVRDAIDIACLRARGEDGWS